MLWDIICAVRQDVKPKCGILLRYLTTIFSEKKCLAFVELALEYRRNGSKREGGTKKPQTIKMH